jgi:hypothetical protein
MFSIGQRPLIDERYSLLINNREISILFGSFSEDYVFVHSPLRHNLSRLCVAAISRHSL